MNKILKVDMHDHTNGVSLCAIKTPEEVIDIKIAQGYDGMVITNHIQPWYYKPGEYPLIVEKQIKEYKRAIEYGKKKNFPVVFGCEVTISNPFYSDWLLYGINEKFLQNSSILCEFSQKDLFELCQKNNILMIQAHPFREGHRLMDLKYMNGIEINCATDVPFKDKIIKIDKDNNLILTVGTDYHGGGDLRGGLLIPETMFTNNNLVNYLKNCKEINYFINDEVGVIKYE